MSLEIQVPEEMRARYLSRRKSDIELLRNSIANRSLDEFKRIGHQLKGNAASYGYLELEKIAMAMEDAASHQDFEKAQAELHHLEDWLSAQTSSAN